MDKLHFGVIQTSPQLRPQHGLAQRDALVVDLGGPGFSVLAAKALKGLLKSQYHASLAMLRAAIERCPAEEWLSTAHKNAFWQVSYHALFFAHLYLQRDEAAF